MYIYNTYTINILYYSIYYIVLICILDVYIYIYIYVYMYICTYMYIYIILMHVIINKHCLWRIGNINYIY